MTPATRLAFLALAACPAVASAAERTYSIADFERIRVVGPFRVDLITDRMTTARAKGTPDALDRVRLDVQGRTLFVRLDRSNFGTPDSMTPPAVITIRAPAVREASIAGSGLLSVSGMKGLRVSAIVEGSGSLSVTNVDADRMDVGVIGTGVASLSGKVRSASVTARGAASVKASALQSDDLSVTWESAGDGAFAARRTAKVTSIGTGNVAVTGNAACTVTNAGNGEVACGQ